MQRLIRLSRFAALPSEMEHGSGRTLSALFS